MTTITIPSTMASNNVLGRLAINGGPPVRSQPMPPRFLFGREEKQAVMDLFDQAMREGSQVLGYNGPQEEAYGKEFAEFLGGGYADGVNSGTNAVYVALRALELEPGSEVIVPTITDCGGVMPVPLCNLIPVIADAAPGSYNIGAEQIAARLSSRTRAIIVAHISGLPCDMDPIMELARRHNLRVIEDSAQSHGALYKGRPVGTMGDVAAFSLMFGKHHATAGQGGMVFTKHEKLYWKIRQHADRGKPFGMEKPDGNVLAALNFNMDELHACIGRVQLRKLPAMITRRRELAAKIAEGCRRRLTSVRMITDPPGMESSYWFLFFELDLERLHVDKTQWVAALRAEGLPCDANYWHVPGRMSWHKHQAVFAASGLPWRGLQGDQRAADMPPLPNIEATDARCMRLAIHEGWAAQEIADTLEALAKVEAAYAHG